MQKLVLVCIRICPYSERVRLTLEQKGADYQLKLIDLKNKSEEFTALYQKGLARDPKSDGKIPILIAGETVLTESDLIAWYVAEKYDSGTQLIPADPMKRFRVRQFARNFQKIVTNFNSFKGWAAKSEEEKERLLSKSAKDLQQLNDQLIMPYAMGEQFSLADLLIYPWIIRWPAVQVHAGMPRNHYLVKIKEWIGNIRSRQAVKKDLQPPQFYIDGFAGHI